MLRHWLALGLFVFAVAGYFAGCRPKALPGFRRVAWAVDLAFALAVAFFLGFVFGTLLPHVFAHGRGSWPYLALGLGAMWLLENRVFPDDPCCDLPGHRHPRGVGLVSLLAMSVCSLNDGVLVGLLSPPLLSGLALGMAVHKFTSSFAAGQLLVESRMGGAALWWAGLAFAAVSPVALYGGSFLSAAAGDGRLGAGLLAFSTGLLVYVAVAQMGPHAWTVLRGKPASRLPFALTLAASLAMGALHGSYHTLLERKLEATPSARPVAP